MNGWAIYFGLSRFFFPWGSSTGSLTQRFKSSGYHAWVLQTGAMKIRRGTNCCFIFRRTLEIMLIGKMDKEDLCSNFVSLHMSPGCKDLDDRLYIEVVDGISPKQIDLLSENLVVEKPHEKLPDEEATLKSVVFFLIPCLLLYSVLKASIML